MSLIKNLRRREVEIFGAKRVIRNDFKEKDKKEEKSKSKPTVKRSKKKTEGK